MFDGVAAWEMAWPYRAGYGGNYPGDVALDQQVISGSSLGPGTYAHGKTYMMPLSTVQYKAATTRMSTGLETSTSLPA